jgi:hypothetical protein
MTRDSCCIKVVLDSTKSHKLYRMDSQCSHIDGILIAIALNVCTMYLPMRHYKFRLQLTLTEIRLTERVDRPLIAEISILSQDDTFCTIDIVTSYRCMDIIIEFKYLVSPLRKEGNS